MNIGHEINALLKSTANLSSAERDYFRQALDTGRPVEYARHNEGPGQELILSLSRIIVFEE